MLALAAGSACVDDPYDHEPADGDFRLVSPDPAASSVYDVCPASDTYNGRPVTIRYPVTGTCIAVLEDRPLVLVLRGAGFGYQKYDYLLDHLAANGFVAVSVDLLATDDVAGHTASAVTLEGVLDDLLASWAMAGQIDPTRLAIVGHSRGGETARYLADHLAGNADNWTVRAIVGLASKATGNHPIVGDETTGLLVLHGAADSDQNPGVGYSLYDGSGTEGGIFFPSDTVYKSMKLLESGTHFGFAEDNLGFIPTQAQVAKGYVLAFLSAHLFDDLTWYDDYIRGDDVPNGWPNSVTTQVSDATLRKVIDNFEDGTVSSPTIGGGGLADAHDLGDGPRSRRGARHSA